MDCGAWAPRTHGQVAHLWLVGHRALRDVPRVAAVWNVLVEELSDEALKERARPRRQRARQ